MKFSKFLGFGPVVPDGLGIGYNVVASKLGAVISSNKVNLKYFLGEKRWKSEILERKKQATMV